MENIQLTIISEQLLFAVKTGKETVILRSQLENIPIEELSAQLITDDHKKAFWINIYNSYFLILRKEKNINKPNIYKKRLIPIAGKCFSLDEIEHGILRKNKFKYSLGYLPNYFASKLIKQLAVETLDYRIHFALNCGAKSCPPIAFYKTANINDQLSLATHSFLEGESSFNHDKKTIHTTALFKWYFADFGGKKGIRNIFQQFFNQSFNNYTIHYNPYSWDEDLGNFSTI